MPNTRPKGPFPPYQTPKAAIRCNPLKSVSGIFRKISSKNWRSKTSYSMHSLPNTVLLWTLWSSVCRRQSIRTTDFRTWLMGGWDPHKNCILFKKNWIAWVRLQPKAEEEMVMMPSSNMSFIKYLKCWILLAFKAKTWVGKHTLLPLKQYWMKERRWVSSYHVLGRWETGLSLGMIVLQVYGSGWRK